MNRLTKRHNNGASWNGNPDHSTQVRYRELLDRLAAYEDTGLTPVEVAEMAKAKVDGRCVVLPCKVGDTVYETLFEWDCTECLKTSFKPKVRERKVTHFMLAKSGDIILGVAGNGADYLIYGKTVFLTRDEAEAALRKEQGDEM